MVYERVQKSSSWNPSPQQKKSKSLYGPRTFSVQPKPETKSSQNKSKPTYSSAAADKLYANIMRSYEAKAQRQAEVLQSQSESEAKDKALMSPTSGTIQCQGELEESDAQEMPPIQAKLTLGQPGDKYEQEADAMAAKVVGMINAPTPVQPVQRQSESGEETELEPTVMRLQEGGFGKGEYNPGISGERQSIAHELTLAVQRSTDMGMLTNTIANEKYQTGHKAKTLKELIDEKYPDVKRDNNYSNLEKRQFEEKLVVVVFNNLDTVWDAVKKVSNNILRYLEQKKVQELVEIQEYLDKLKSPLNILGSQSFIPEQGKSILQDQTFASLPSHLNVHNQFYQTIYRKDYEEKKAEKIAAKIEGLSYRGVAKLDGANANAEHPMQNLNPPELFDLTDPGSPTGRPRLNSKLRELVPHISGLEPMPAQDNSQPDPKSLPRLPIEDEIKGRPTDASQEHTRGIDLFVLDEIKTWVQEARIELDMPLSAGPSGSAALMLSAALEMGLTSQQEKLQYVMALVASIVGGGHHTFHEIMTVAKIAGVPYTPGQYRGVYPDSLKECDDFKKLVLEYPHFLAE